MRNRSKDKDKAKAIYRRSMCKPAALSRHFFPPPPPAASQDTLTDLVCECVFVCVFFFFAGRRALFNLLTPTPLSSVSHPAPCDPSTFFFFFLSLMCSGSCSREDVVRTNPPASFYLFIFFKGCLIECRLSDFVLLESLSSFVQ